MSGAYFGSAVGPLWLASDAADRGKVGNKLLVDLRLGAAMWDQFALDFSLDVLLLDDRMPFSEDVVTCTTNLNDPAPVERCGDPESEESSVSGAALSIEGGYQRRFDLDGPMLTLLPGLMLGYQGTVDPLTRSVGCSGCRDEQIEGVETSGVYLSPFVRVAFVALLGISVRWRWYFTGDLTNALLFGVDLGLP